MVPGAWKLSRLCANARIHNPDAALTMDLTHLFVGRHATPGAWETVMASVRTTLARVAVDAAGRPVHLRGLVGLPTAVALGATTPAPSGLDASWVQRAPGHPDALCTLNTAPEPSGLAVYLVDSAPSATDTAVLVSVSENTVPAFQATTGLGPFRGIVEATGPGNLPHRLETPGQALDLAQAVVRSVRLPRYLDLSQQKNKVELVKDFAAMQSLPNGVGTCSLGSTTVVSRRSGSAS